MAAEPCRNLEALDACPGGHEAHIDHLDLNGECPWCGAYTAQVAIDAGLPTWQPGTTSE